MNAFVLETKLTLRSLEIEMFVKLSRMINYRCTSVIVWDIHVSVNENIVRKKKTVYSFLIKLMY